MASSGLATTLVTGLLAALLASSSCAAEVRADHPRMLLTKDDLPPIRARCETTHKATWDEMK